MMSLRYSCIVDLSFIILFYFYEITVFSRPAFSVSLLVSEVLTKSGGFVVHNGLEDRFHSNTLCVHSNWIHSGDGDC
jgi:hypothetical protein